LPGARGRAPGISLASLSRAAALALAGCVAGGLTACGGRDAPTESSPVKSVSITLENAQIFVGATTRATAVLRDVEGNTVSDRLPTWTSLTPSVVTVSATGDITGLQAGTGQVRAASGSASADVTILVRNPLAGTFRLARDTATLVVPGGSVQAIPSVTDEAGRPVTNPNITWASSQPLVASVNVAGLVTAVASGSAYITGSIDGLTATLTVTVRPAPNAAAPTVVSIVPSILRPGGAYTVTGTNFGATPGANQVLADGMTASVQTASPTQLTIVLPTTGFTCEPARNGFLQVTAGGLVGGVAAPLQVGTRRALLVGQSFVVTAASDVRCNELVPASGRWVVSLYNATRATVSPSAPAGVQFAIRGLTTAPGAAPQRAPAIEMLRTPPSATLLAAARATPDRARAAAHEDLLERNLAAARQGPRASGAAPASVRAGLGVRSVPNTQVTTLGAITNVKLPNLDAADFCVSNVPIGVRTAFVGAHSVILEDTTSTFNARPTLKGQMDDYFRRLGEEFEEEMWPILTGAFGNPLAMDPQLGGPGKVVMVFSPRINAMQHGNVVGFVASCDLFPVSQRPSSNTGAFFYAIVPTSTASGYTNSETRDQWLRLLRATVIHEVRHVTSFAERTSRGLALEDASWEEGAARIAEEMYARRVYGKLLPRANMTYAQTLGCDIHYLDGTAGCADRPILMLRHFDGLYGYMASPEIYSPLGRTFSGEVAFYAGAWSMLRWAADHFGTLESQFFRDFTFSAVTGSANIEARTGRFWEESLGEWSLAMYLDDLSGYAPLAERMKFPSWNLADIWAGMCADLGPCRDPTNPVQIYGRNTPFLPRTRAFGNFLLGVGTMAGGGFTILDLTGPSAASQVIELKSLIGTADPPSTLRIAIARVR
jgi:hypothetical protein